MSKRKRLVLYGITAAWLAMAWAQVAWAWPTCPLELPFDDLPAGYFSNYGYDLNNDGTEDVLFETEISPGWRASTSTAILCPPVVHPGLQGTTASSMPEIIVQFPAGASGSIDFDFAVPSPLSTSGSPKAYITLLSADPFLFKSATAQAYGTPAVGTLHVDFGFVAVMAHIQFYAGSGSSYIMDNFRIESISPAPATSGCPGDGDRDGDFDGSDLADSLEGAHQMCLLEQWAEYFGTTDCLEE